MTTATYLHQCLKEGLTVRWPDTAMPINVYIAPFRWYEKSKQQQAALYHQMLLDAFDTWSKISGEIVRFRLVNSIHDSQIDVKWRRVDRKSLGHCEYMVNDRAQVYSAEIQIGLSDGVLYAQYNDADEVRHTILHEVGHALGLVGHSDHPDDIMYVPHQYGVAQLSPRDIETLRWLYKLPPGFNYLHIGKKYELPEPFTFHDVLDALSNKTRPKAAPTSPNPAPRPPVEKPEVLLEHHQILSEMGRFHLSTQNIRVSPEVKKLFIQKNINPPEKPL